MYHAPQPAELPEFLHHKLFPMWREPPVQDRRQPQPEFRNTQTSECFHGQRART